MENTEMAKKKSDPNFNDANYHQNAFVAVSQADQIQVGTFEHAIQHLIDNKLDLTLFNKRYKNANGGAAAYMFWSNPTGHLVKGDKLPNEVKYDNSKNTAKVYA